MEWIIYKHENKINGKIYIGQTKQSLTERWRNGNGYKNNTYFYNAIIKYGWDNFSHEILEDNILTVQNANEREIYWIDKYDSFKNGYNLTSGGDNRDHLGIPILQIDIKSLEVVNAFQTIRHAEEVTGTDHSQISRCCKRLKGNISAGGFYWCFQNEWKENWNPKERIEPSAYNKQEVYQMNKGADIINRFSSIRDASKITGIYESTISQCCLGKRISAGGYYWCYVGDVQNFVPGVSQDERPVVRVDMENFENIKVYKNISEAAKKNNIKSPELISRVCKGKQVSAGGYYWVYQEDFDFNWQPRRNKNFTRVRCVETQVIYNSIKEAIEKTGASNAIKRCCKNPKMTSGGYHWEYVD